MNNKYLISLHKRRSIIALIAAVIMLLCYTYSIYGGIVICAEDDKATELFRYFTIETGCYGALVSAMLIPYAVDGLIKKRFTYPHWMAMLHYSSVVCTALVFVFAVCAISFFDPVLAFGGYNFYLHIICPILILFAFMLVESDTEYSAKDSLICMLPFVIYSIVYLYNVIVIGKWDDIYQFNSFIPFYISAPLMYLLTYLIALVIRKLNNRKNRIHHKQMTKAQDDDLDEVAIKIDVYGLGRYNGLHGESGNINMNLDILMDLSDRYGIRLEDLTRAYSKGVIDGIRETADKR